MYAAKGPNRGGLNQSKSQTFLRQEADFRDPNESRNSVVRMSASNSQLKNSNSSYINPTMSVRKDQFESFDPQQQHVLKFKEEFQFVIRNAENQGRNLYLMDVLEQLDFIDEGILGVQSYEDPLDIYNMLKERIQTS